MTGPIGAVAVNFILVAGGSQITGQILNQAPAAYNVEHLHTAANGQHRLVGVYSGFDQIIVRSIAPIAVFCVVLQQSAVLFAVKVRVNILSAGNDNTVHTPQSVHCIVIAGNLGKMGYNAAYIADNILDIYIVIRIAAP